MPEHKKQDDPLVGLNLKVKKSVFPLDVITGGCSSCTLVNQFLFNNKNKTHLY